MQGRFGHMLPEHIASVQQQANRNWETIGMDVPAALREDEDPERHRRMRDETYSMPLNRGVGAYARARVTLLTVVSTTPGPSASPRPRTIIPLMPGVARPRSERRVLSHARSGHRGGPPPWC